MIHGRNAHDRYAAARLAFVLLAGCSRQPAADPQVVAAPVAQPVTVEPAVGTNDAVETNDAQVMVVIGDDADASPVADTRTLRDPFAQCLEAAGGVDSAMQDCIGSEYDYQDGRLNAVCAERKRTLADAKMTGLRTAQRPWLSDRDSKCVWDANTEG